MNTKFLNNGLTYLLTGDTLEENLRTIIREELQILIHKINRESKMLTREDAAEKIGVCPNTISEYIKKGYLKNRGKGRRIMILESDLEDVKTNSFKIYKLAA
jgi:hypothetical protein